MSTYQAHINKFTTDIVVNGTNKIDVDITFTDKQSGSYENELYIELGKRNFYKYFDSTSPQTVSFTIPIDWLAQIPDSPLGTGKIRLQCVNMNTGEMEYEEAKNFTVYVPEEFKPTVSNLSVEMQDIKNTTVDYAAYGLTRPFVRALVTPHSTSPIRKWYITGGGVTASGDPYMFEGEEYNFSALGELIRTWSSTTFTLTVEDGRGRTASITSAAFYVYPYNRPIVKSLSAYRTDKDGITKTDGGYIKVTIDGAMSSLKDSEGEECNSLSCYVDWKEVNGSYSHFTPITNNTPFIFEANKDTNFEIKCTLRDKYMETEAYANVTGDLKDFNIADGGGGAAIGMKATKGYFDVAHNTRLQKGLSANQGISSREGFVSTGTGSKGDFLSFGEATMIKTMYHTVKDEETGSSYIVVDSWGDFNDHTELGLYGVYEDYDVSSSNYYRVLNAPCEKAGTMRVYNATGNALSSALKQHRMQEYVVYDGSAIYRRCLSKERDNGDVEWPENWSFGSWYCYLGTKV